MINRLLIAAAVVALTAPVTTVAQTLCEDPSTYCRQQLDTACIQLERVGAAAIAVTDVASTTDCATQFDNYRACLGRVPTECGGGAAAASSNACSPEDARQLFAALENSSSVVQLEAFVTACAGTPQALLARARLQELRAASAPQTQTPTPVLTPAPLPTPPEFPTEADFRAAQRELQRLGYYTSRIDGNWGPGSRRALAAYQRDFRVRDTGGQLTEAVLAALRIAERKATGNPIADAALPGQIGSTDTALSDWAGDTRQPGETFRDCPDCPEMVSIPGGSFTMGSPASEPDRDNDEGPQRTVRVAPFALGKYEVTFAEWDACVSAGGCSNRPNTEWGRGRQPVMRVSWNDAQEYLGWLNRQVSGSPYRLPSEAEWEYAARAGTTTPFWTGQRITTDQANFAGDFTYNGSPKGVYREKTVPVGSFNANPFGLHDVHGNVWEWVQDCWNGGYSGAPTNGSAWMSGECSRAVLRGGSWNFYPRFLRSAYRGKDHRDSRSNYIGFRVARTLNR